MALILIISFLFNAPLIHGSILVSMVGICLKKNIPIKRLLQLLVPLVPILLMIVVFAGFANPSYFTRIENHQVILCFGESMGLTSGGIKLGLTYMIRMVNMVALTALLLGSTGINDFIQLFQKLKLPRSITFVLTTAIRFIPELERKRRSQICPN